MADIRDEMRKVDDMYDNIILFQREKIRDSDEMILALGAFMISYITNVILTQRNYKVDKLPLTERIEVIQEIIIQDKSPDSDKFIKFLTNYYKLRNIVAHTPVYESLKNITPETIIQDLKWITNWFKNYMQIYASPLTPDTFYNSENSPFTYSLKYLEINNYQSLKNIKILNIPVE